jgi:hypothetical protein
MTKKDELKLVFGFIAEYLKEEEPKEITKKVLLSENEETKTDDVIVNKTTPDNKFKLDATHIKELMERVEAKTVEQATVNNLLANQKKQFDKEIKKVKEEYVNNLINKETNEETNEKTNDETIKIPIL